MALLSPLKASLASAASPAGIPKILWHSSNVKGKCRVHRGRINQPWSQEGSQQACLHNKSGAQDQSSPQHDNFQALKNGPHLPLHKDKCFTTSCINDGPEYAQRIRLDLPRMDACDEESPNQLYNNFREPTTVLWSYTFKDGNSASNNTPSVAMTEHPSLRVLHQSANAPNSPGNKLEELYLTNIEISDKGLLLDMPETPR
jgi:hypothetical protein